jgi:hypothetical protein
VRLRNPQDEAAWGDCFDLNTPLECGFVRGQGMQDADAADRSQERLRGVTSSTGRLDHDPWLGAFPNWLIIGRATQRLSMFGSQWRLDGQHHGVFEPQDNSPHGLAVLCQSRLVDLSFLELPPD